MAILVVWLLLEERFLSIYYLEEQFFKENRFVCKKTPLLKKCLEWIFLGDAVHEDYTRANNYNTKLCPLSRVSSVDTWIPMSSATAMLPAPPSSARTTGIPQPKFSGTSTVQRPRQKRFGVTRVSVEAMTRRKREHGVSPPETTRGSSGTDPTPRVSPPGTSRIPQPDPNHGPGSRQASFVRII
jgi:hypothetical protein